MRQAVAVALIAALGIVGGSAISQIDQADAGPSYDRQILQELRDITQELNAIKYNTGAVCEEARTGYLCKKF